MVTTMAPSSPITRPDTMPVVPYGLFSVVDAGEPDSAGRWVNGISFDHPTCVPASGFATTCDEDTITLNIGDHESVTHGQARSNSSAFSVITEENCTPVGRSTDDIYASARERHIRHAQEYVEGVISGRHDLGTTPTFAGATTLGGGAVTPSYGLGLLAEHAAMTYGVQGAVIHAPRRAVGPFQNMVTREGAHLETLTGEKVSLGGGYANESPAGVAAAAGSAWLYVTPPVLLYSSEIIDLSPSDRFHPGTNTGVGVVMQQFLAAWENCPIAAVLVTLDG